MGLTEPTEILKGPGGLSGHNYLYLFLIFPVGWIIYLIKKIFQIKISVTVLCMLL